jgi:large subunit ribosomal protein L3
MSEPEKISGATTETAAAGGAELAGLYAFKVGMSAIFSETGERIPVTVLKYEQMSVSQVKTKDKDGYDAIQVGFCPSRASRSSASEKKNFAKAGFENGAKFVREIRGKDVASVEVGAKIGIGSLKKGDLVKLTSRSRGRGFAGVVQRYKFAGGPATHGSGFHRKPGSVGNRTWPGRVIPGKRMAGHMGDIVVTLKNVEIVDVIPSENVLFVKGAVPGHRNSLVQLMKMKV